jgi:hypothetical protein
VTLDKLFTSVAWGLVTGIISTVILGALKSSEEEDDATLADAQEDS